MTLKKVLRLIPLKLLSEGSDTQDAARFVCVNVRRKPAPRQWVQLFIEGGGNKIDGHPIKEDGEINVKEHYPEKLLPGYLKLFFPPSFRFNFCAHTSYCCREVNFLLLWLFVHRNGTE